jgi:hypothetical protein
MSIGIIGCGAAGSILLLELIQRFVDPATIVVVDPQFDGGDLVRKWGAINSNTKWSQMVEVFREYPTATAAVTTLSAKYGPDQVTLLADLAWLLRSAIQPILAQVQTRTEHCSYIQQTATGWQIVCPSGTEEVATLYVCTGADPKTLDFGKPTIPLEIALDPIRLARLVRPGEKVCVFGLAHSGTLCIHHLVQAGTQVTGFYNQEKPFYFARDGEYDGIKQESAEIADAILANSIPVRLCAFKDTKALVKAIQKADWIVSATGFTGRTLEIRDVQGALVTAGFSPATGRIAENLYGFGIAYPGESMVGDRTFKDVGLPSFSQQIKRCLSSNR